MPQAVPFSFPFRQMLRRSCPGGPHRRVVTPRQPAPRPRHRQWKRPGGEAGSRPLPDRPAAAPPPGLHVRSEEVARLEATLFLAREPLTTRRLAKLAGLADGTRARTLLKELKDLHDAAGSAFRVEAVAGGYRLLTRAPFGPWVRRFTGLSPQTRLSAAALETLAIVAYRQPVTRAEIEAIRGVGCEEMLRQLMERDLAAIGGRTEDLGRPNVYVTTRRFLEAFGLSRIEDLPPVDPAPPAPVPGGDADPSPG